MTAYTRGSAYAEFAEGEKGTLAPGMLTDLVVLSQDIFTVASQALPGPTSVLTLVGGRHGPRRAHPWAPGQLSGRTLEEWEHLTESAAPSILLTTNLDIFDPSVRGPMSAARLNPEDLMVDSMVIDSGINAATLPGTSEVFLTNTRPVSDACTGGPECIA